MTAGSGGPANLDLAELAHCLGVGPAENEREDYLAHAAAALAAEVKAVRRSYAQAIDRQHCWHRRAETAEGERDAARAALERVRGRYERDVATLFAAAERVRELHRPQSDGGGRTVCSSCLAYTSPIPARIPWPCATVRALDPGAEPGEQQR